MNKVTNWFPADIKPVRTGWYEALGWWRENAGQSIVKRFFDVEKQKWFWNSPDKGFHPAGFSNDDKWRGLAKKP